MVLTGPESIDAGWVETALRRARAIERGAVAALDLEPMRERAWSRIVRLGVRYRARSTGELPTRLLLKLCGGDDAFGRSEVDYYLRDYADAPDAPLVRCFDAAYDATSRHYHLLLEDLSASHTNGDAVESDEAFADALADSAAALHAHRWGEARLRDIGGSMPSGDDVKAYVDHIAPGLEPLLAHAGSALTDDQATRLRALFATLAERFIERCRDPRGFTLVHGDLNPGNLLVPRERAGPVLFIDRQPFDWSLTRWLGAGDLAYAMLPWWDVARRRRLETRVLDRYHAGLLARGVADYPRERLQADYRLCVAMALAVPVEWCVLESDRERMRWLWSLQLERTLAAWADHAA